jgi:hypothetical protein
VWAGLATLFVLSPTVDSVTYLLTAVVAVESLVLLTLIALSPRRRSAQ